MTDQKNEGAGKTETSKSSFEAEFEALPLDKKFARLFKMEVATLSEAFEKVGDVITEFGTKLENEVRRATQTCEQEAPGPTAGPAPKPKARTKRKGPPPKAAP